MVRGLACLLLVVGLASADLQCQQPVLADPAAFLEMESNAVFLEVETGVHSPFSTKGVYNEAVELVFSHTPNFPPQDREVATLEEFSNMIRTDVGILVQTPSSNVRVLNVTAGNLKLAISVSCTSAAPAGWMDAIATKASSSAFIYASTKGVYRDDHSRPSNPGLTFVSASKKRSLNTCAFCRKLIKNSAEGKVAKCGGENMVACQERVASLVQECKVTANDTCCKQTATAVVDAEPTPTPEQCSKMLCATVARVCPTGSVAKPMSKWATCCFNPTSDCSSDKCDVDNGCCDGNATCQSGGPAVDCGGSSACGKSSVQCKCNYGYTGDGKKCAVVNPCTSDRKKCGSDAHCVFAGPGQSFCACNPGFTTTDLDAGRVACSFIDVCAVKENGGCSPKAVCKSTGPGAAVCTCEPGYTGSGYSCELTSPCESSTEVNGGCAPTATCAFDERLGKSCKCPQFHHGDGYVCTANNPCESDSSCDEHASCHNSAPGKRLCLCNSGYKGDGSTCAVVDMCSIGFPCSRNAKCSLLAPGQSQCTCNTGFSGDGVTCDFINSCEHNFGGCHKEFGICKKTGPGTNFCKCKVGYEFQDKIGSQMGASTDFGNVTNCRKINSCDAARTPPRGGCHEQATCTSNGPAESSCACNKGYFGNGKWCTEFNKCELGTDGCNQYADCIHQGRGHFECKCWPDYSGDGKNCEKICKIDPSDCKHNSVLHQNYNAECKCVDCPMPWTHSGDRATCDTCSLGNEDCNGGRLNEKLCICEQCPFPFGGDRCNICERHELSCQHSSTFNPETCKCEGCQKYTDANGQEESKWSGDMCQECTRTAESCNGRGTLDWNHNGGTCTCHCKNSWTGEKCDKCLLTNELCMHGTTANKDSCECEFPGGGCEGGWKGQQCDNCGLSIFDCEHEGDLDRDTCSCKYCKSPWQGARCNECSLSDTYCKHGQLDKALCKCVECAAMWKGDACETCDRKNSACYNGGQIDPETCECTKCSHGHWGGELCNKCMRAQSECQHGSDLNDKKCECSEKCLFPYVAPDSIATCGTCKLTASDCLNGGTIDPRKCSCTCEHPYSGSRCALTKIGPDSCKNGATYDASTKSCTNCQPPFAGQTCSICEEGLDEKCENGASLDPTNCKCAVKCGFPWGGLKCATCIMAASDCQHGSTLDSTSCTCNCESSKTSDDSDVRWGGTTCAMCQLTKADCRHGSTLDRKFCRCVDQHAQPGLNSACPGNWAGTICDQCTKSAESCNNGATFRPGHCDCYCPQGMGTTTGFKGRNCENVKCLSDRSGRECSHAGLCHVQGLTGKCKCNDKSGDRCQYARTDTKTCSITGLGHMKTFDEYLFQNNKNGVFKLFSYSQDINEEEIQVMQGATTQGSGSGLTGIAIRKKAQPYSSDKGTLMILSKPGAKANTAQVIYNGVEVPYTTIMEKGSYTFANGLSIVDTPGKGLVVESDTSGLYMTITFFNPDYLGHEINYMNMFMTTRMARMGLAHGLCGNFDNNKRNDAVKVNETGRPRVGSTVPENLFMCVIDSVDSNKFLSGRVGAIADPVEAIEDPKRLCESINGTVTSLQGNGASTTRWNSALRKCSQGNAPCFRKPHKGCQDNPEQDMPSSGCRILEPFAGRYQPSACHQCLYDYCATLNTRYVTFAKEADGLEWLSTSTTFKAANIAMKSRNEVASAVKAHMDEERYLYSRR